MKTALPIAACAVLVPFANACFSSDNAPTPIIGDDAGGLDGTIDTGSGEASPPDDSPAEAAPEATVEAAVEAGPEASGAEGGPEASAEAGPDGSPDASPEAGGHSGPWQYALVAGNGSQGFGGDNGPATSAQLGGYLSGAAADSNGNVYIADAGNARIRMVSAAGTITTFAGNGTGGYTGDTGPATSAEINGPSSIAIDAMNNVYFSEFNNQDIRIVDHATGNIDTYVSLGGQPTGICLDAAGNLYVAMFSQNQVWKYDTSKTKTVIAGTGTTGPLGDGGQATAANLSNPNGVWADAHGNVYIVDNNHARIRKVDTSGVITTVAGNGTAGFMGDEGPATSAEINSSYGVMVDSAGNVYIADTGNNRIRQVDTAGIIHTIAGDGTTTFTSASGPALSVGLNGPGYAWMSAQGEIYASGNWSVYKVY
jgi:sugar lactone lactonase YvrE